MGAYLSEPVTEKVSSDEGNEKLECAASSMQGWRVNQEDSHNTILDFDENTSLFAVYDGHGGAEVATYCSSKLPDFIKNTEAYKSGELVKALEDAFLGFDATIATKEVMDILKELAGEINPAGPSDNDESEDENVSNLYQEARLPLQEVLAKYENKLSSLHRNRLGDSVTPLSPCLRAKKNEEKAGGSASGSSNAGAGSSLAAAGSSCEPGAGATSSQGAGAGASSSQGAGGASSSQGAGGASSSQGAGGASSSQGAGAGASSSQGAGAGASSSQDAAAGSNGLGDDAGGVSSTNTEDKASNGEVSTSDTPKKMEVDKQAAPDSSEDNREEPQQSEPKPAAKETCNGEVTNSKSIDAEEGITSSNGDATPLKGKNKAKLSAVSSSEKQVPARPSKSRLRRAAAAVYSSLLARAAEDGEAGEDDSDEDDETFEGGELPGGGEPANGLDDSSNDEGEAEEEDEEEEEEEDSSDEDGEEDISSAEEPGLDSGCTAVVALLRGTELYVGNAGDSRCVVCRGGRALDMSVDHKPEDAAELSRVTKAGGKVSVDGRINGGLNLSRAIGDHSYKQNKELSDKEQMITALPDVRTLSIDPADQFMVLACDGIWNFMSSQDVCDFILPRLAEGRERLSQICEEMFDHCLAPSTMGDGTGCDNMTAIIVRFKDGLVAEAARARRDPAPAPAGPAPAPGAKRLADDAPADTAQDTKRQKTDDSVSSSVVTSSV